jgi:hypothetical protein
MLTPFESAIRQYLIMALNSVKSGENDPKALASALPYLDYILLEQIAGVELDTTYEEALAKLPDDLRLAVAVANFLIAQRLYQINRLRPVKMSDIETCIEGMTDPLIDLADAIDWYETLD